MGQRQEFRLPDLGEGLTEAEVVSWHVASGDTVVLNQVIAEVETEKAVVELPSPFAGTVLEILAQAGATVEVGAPIIAMEVDALDVTGVEDVSAPGAAEQPVPTLVGYGPSEAPVSRRHRRRGGLPMEPATGPEVSRQRTPPPVRPLAKPPVRYTARVKGVDLADVVGTGPDGIITREDVDRYADGPPVSKASGTDHGQETRTPVRGVRKHTAEAMVRSAFTAPHVTEFLTIDVTPTMDLVEEWRTNAVFEGVHLTPLTVIAKAVLVALEGNPSLNSSWDEEHQEIMTKHYVNLGIAAATPRGLVVPNIKNAHTLKLRELAASLAALTTTAREGHSTPAALSGGTITITNIGVFGVDAGTPIINPGEAAILCVGAVRRRPWEHRGEIALRQVVTLSLSFDHRLVDGQEGSIFLAAVGRMLADPTYLLALS